jgi:putative DNA primase/helicase
MAGAILEFRAATRPKASASARVTTARPASLVVRQESNNTEADLADLRSARFVMTSETEQRQRLAEGKLKRITQGMGRIKATRRYENPIEFDDTHRLWMDANHKPEIRGTDNAVWNRLHLIPFDVTMPKDEIDHGLPAKLAAEAPGILPLGREGRGANLDNEFQTAVRTRPG